MEEIIMVTDAEMVNNMFKSDFTEGRGCHVDKDGISKTATSIINKNLFPIKRSVAETDTSLKQPIMYVLFSSSKALGCGCCSERVYLTTERLKGDKRLTGMISLGIGGHINEGEDIYSSMYREIEEEVGVTSDWLNENNITYSILGVINSNRSSVDKVHVGIVVEFKVNEQNMKKIKFKEQDKHMYKWMTVDDIKLSNSKGKVESWGKILIKNNMIV